MIVEATVNGHGPLRFILDTGANFSAITRAGAESIGVVADRSAYITDISGDRRAYPFGWADEVEVGPVSFRRMPFVVTDNLAEVKDRMGVVGLLGYPGFDEFTLDLDYPAGEVRVSDARLTRDQPGVVPLRRIGHETPEIRIELLGDRGEPVDARWFAVDSGGSAPLHLPESMRDWSHHDLGVPIGVGRGLSGIKRTNDVALLRGPVRIGRVIVEHAVAETNNHHTLIGHELLRLFRVRLDPRSGLASLTPADTAADRIVLPPPVTLGLTDFAKLSDAYLVVSIARGSPAELAGMRPGDTIIAIDGVPVEAGGQLDNHPEPDAPPVVLTLDRGDVILDLTLTPAPLFDPARATPREPDLTLPGVRLITHPDGTRGLILPDASVADPDATDP